MTPAPGSVLRWEVVSRMGSFFPSSRRTLRPFWAGRRGTFFAYKGRAPGSTLVELAVAIAIIGILAAVGWGTLRNQVAQFHLMQAARLLHSDLQNLRTLAITTNRETRVVFTVADQALDPADIQSGEWLLQVGNRSTSSTEWDTLPIDLNGEGVSDLGERSLAEGGYNECDEISLAPWPTLVGPGTTNADSLVFSPRGWITNPPADFPDGYVVLDFVNKRALARGVDQRARVRISRGGLARIETSENNRLPENPVGAAEASTQ